MTLKYILHVCLIPLFVWAAAAPADETPIGVEVAPEVLETGLMKHLLPRFSLKTGTRLQLVTEDGDVVIGAEGTAFMQGLDQIWYVSHSDAAGAKRFAEWLNSEVGQRTLASFAPNGTALFGAAPEQDTAEAELAFEGDPTLGLTIAELHCSRCHAVIPGKRLNDIGSTPSFFVLRTLRDWPERFAAFYALNPHPAFTQIADVTAPFPESRPPPIAPIELTLEEVEAVLAYVAGLEAADLGGALVHQ